jgi:putative acetyltransferase
MLVIRPERAGDLDAIRAVNRSAFGQDDEARLVDALRSSPAFVPELSLVAEIDGVVCGHILFSRIGVRSEAGVVPALALAPMAVDPERQRRGIGSALVRHGLEDARRLGHRVVIVVGHPEYYPRFGFQPASRWGVKALFAVPDEAFLLVELEPGSARAGAVEYPREFEGV